MKVNRRGFVSGFATALAYLACVRPPRLQARRRAAGAGVRVPDCGRAARVAEYDPAAKLSSNENPWGPLDSVMEAMNSAWKYSNRYGYPDGDIKEAIAAITACRRTTSCSAPARAKSWTWWQRRSWRAARRS